MSASAKRLPQAGGELAARLREMIADAGPISVADYMSHCLYDPEDGYYRVREPIGRGGDFITSPEISQIFGELIGLWAVENWRSMGSPASLRLIELGPGRGTLMADALRAGALVPDFIDALDVHLIEASERLQMEQKRRLDESGAALSWHQNLETVPDGPAIIIANEFFDALPIRQFEWRHGAWYERCVGLDDAGGFAFCCPDPLDAASKMIPAHLQVGTRDGAVFEVRPGCRPITQEMGRRAAGDELAALIFDYGHIASAHGETLQAVHRHTSVDPLSTPGQTDLTAHVDFEDLARLAAASALRVWGPLDQGALLSELGLAARCEALLLRASSDQARQISSGARRLIDPQQMGCLFKTIAVTSTNLPRPAGFSLPWPACPSEAA